MTDLLDKNKSAYKLKGIGPIYCINLDEQPERWEFMSNQFKYWEIEDKERFYRFNTLGYNVGRINDYVYHLEHARGENSWFSNPHMEDNQHEWSKLCSMNKQQLLEYYSQQDYLKKYG